MTKNVILYAGGSGGCHSAPVCISECPLCWLIRHLKQNKYIPIHLVY